MLASLGSLGFAPTTLPTLTSNYCADVVETLTIEGSKPMYALIRLHPANPLLTRLHLPSRPGNSYTLCVDNTNIRWNQRAADGSNLQIFNGTDYWTLTQNATAEGGWTCQTKTSGPESRTFMPYRITTFDDGTTVNKTSETYDGIADAVDLWHFRQGNPPMQPNENMHWHVAPLAKGAKTQQLLATDCIQKSGMDRKGPLQHGVRDFSKNFGAFAQPALPKGVKCTQMPPKKVEAWHTQNVEFFGAAAIFGF